MSQALCWALEMEDWAPMQGPASRSSWGGPGGRLERGPAARQAGDNPAFDWDSNGESEGREGMQVTY